VRLRTVLLGAAACAGCVAFVRWRRRTRAAESARLGGDDGSVYMVAAKDSAFAGLKTRAEELRRAFEAQG
jgi:hypothetical protein